MRGKQEREGREERNKRNKREREKQKRKGEKKWRKTTTTTKQQNKEGTLKQGKIQLFHFWREEVSFTQSFSKWSQTSHSHCILV